jgi:hypothetical protein
MLRFFRGRVARGHALRLSDSLCPVSLACGHRPRLTLLAVAGLVAASTAAPCLASLGRAPSPLAGATTVHQARALAAASGTGSAGSTNGNTGSASYSVSTTTLAGGTTVREYVGADGVVFAVTWNGPFLPDLRELLGQHFATLKNESARQPKAGRGQVRVAQPDVTIESGGHMRAYAGRAWINSRLPAGFDTDTLE